MTRRRRLVDRVEQRATDAADAGRYEAVIADLLASIDSRDADLVRRVMDGESLHGIARADQVAYAVVHHRFSAAVSRLRHPSRSLLRPFDGDRPLNPDEIHGIVARLDRTIENSMRSTLTWCDHHGWTESLGFSRCGGCPCEIGGTADFGLLPSLGRPRKYCCDACRQRAYRRRSTGQVPHTVEGVS